MSCACVGSDLKSIGFRDVRGISQANEEGWGDRSTLFCCVLLRWVLQFAMPTPLLTESALLFLFPSRRNIQLFQLLFVDIRGRISEETAGLLSFGEGDRISN